MSFASSGHSPTDLIASAVPVHGVARAPYAGPERGVQTPSAGENERTVRFRESVRALLAGDAEAPSRALHPYVPQAWRGVHFANEATVAGAVQSTSVVHSANAPHDGRDESALALSHIDPVDHLPSISAFLPAEDDDWPFTDAAAHASALSDEFALPTQTLLDTAGLAANHPLPMWADDDMFDIMPVSAQDLPSAAAPYRGRNASYDDASGAGAHLPPYGLDHSASDSEFDRHPRSEWTDETLDDQPIERVPEYVQTPGAEIAARMLEDLAARVRLGELTVPLAASELGDAAMLASALAAVLGVR